MSFYYPTTCTYSMGVCEYLLLKFEAAGFQPTIVRIHGGYKLKFDKDIEQVKRYCFPSEYCPFCGEWMTSRPIEMTMHIEAEHKDVTPPPSGPSLNRIGLLLSQLTNSENYDQT